MKALGFSWVLVLGAIQLVSVAAFAEIRLGTPTFRGNGCPAGSVETVLTPDQSALSILYSQFNMTIPKLKSGSKECTLVIPITNIPATKNLIVTQSDFQGFISLPKRAYSIFTALFRLKKKGRTVGADSLIDVGYGPYSDNFYLDTDHSYRLASGCGGSAELEIDAKMTLVNFGKESASFTLDTSNFVSSSTQLRLQLAHCP